MDEQNQAQVVTIEEAIADIKKWANEKDWEKVKEGCEEVLEVNPDNDELKKLLDQANKALNPAPAVAAATPAVTPVAPAQAPISTPLAAPTPIAKPAPVAPAVPSSPSPTDIFKKAPEVKKEEKPTAVSKEEPKKKGKLGMIIATIIFVLLLGGLGYSFYMGWLNPFYEWILRLFGL